MARFLLAALVSASLVSSTAAAATGADGPCDLTLSLHFLKAETDCKASSGVCPSSCLDALKALDTVCAGKKYSYTDTRNGEMVEVALDWDTDKARWLVLYQATINMGFGTNDACNEVIHDYQLEHINDCNEAYYNMAVDLMFGYYCTSPKSDASTCHENCQESIDKVEAVCNPEGGPLGTIYLDNDQGTMDTSDDVYTELTYGSGAMLDASTKGPSACTYKSTAPASSASSLRSLSVVATLLVAMVLAWF